MSDGILNSVLGVTNYDLSNFCPGLAADSPRHDNGCIKFGLANISGRTEYHGYGQLEWISKGQLLTT